MIIQELIDFFETIYPLKLSEGFDNTGFLIGDRHREVKKVLTCLTITPKVVSEAANWGANLIVSHHPFPFLQSKRWTSDSPDGRLLLSLIVHGIAVYSPHTAHDSALWGINEQLAQFLNLENIEPLCPAPFNEIVAENNMLDGLETINESIRQRLGKPLGTGRIGQFNHDISLADFTKKVHEILKCSVIQVVGDDLKKIRTVAIGCGAAESFLEGAAAKGADVLLVGEAKVHTWLKADADSVALVMPGHYHSERFAMETMATRIARYFPQLDVRPSQLEKDPVHYSIR